MKVNGRSLGLTFIVIVDLNKGPDIMPMQLTEAANVVRARPELRWL